MPLPETRDVGKIMHELKKGRKRPRKQRIAIALTQARKHGAKIPKPREKHKHSSGANLYGKLDSF